MARPKKKYRRKPLAGLKPAHKVFCLAYLANGSNAREAYTEAFPNPRRGQGSTDTCAWRLLKKVEVQAFIAARLARIERAVEATADEAMEVISRTLRLDPRLLLDEKGKPKPMQDWPDEVALVVKSVKADGSVVFYDKMRAAELIGESHGRIKKKLDISLAFDHVKHLADKSRPKGE